MSTTINAFTAMAALSSQLIFPSANVIDDAQSDLTIVAQHNAEHSRFGESKKAEPGTGWIAHNVADACDAEAIVQEDPITFNTDKIADRDDKVAKAVRESLKKGNTVIDLHGMNDTHGSDVAIGTGDTTTKAEKEIVDSLMKNFEGAGYRVSTDSEFNATAPWTIGGYAESKDKDATSVQIELAPDLRSKDGRSVTAKLIAQSVCE